MVLLRRHVQHGHEATPRSALQVTSMGGQFFIFRFCVEIIAIFRGIISNDFNFNLMAYLPPYYSRSRLLRS